jgi:hypothetical protein
MTITSTLHDAQYTFLIIPRSALLRMRIISDKSCREYQNTHFMFSIFYLENLAVMRECVKILQSKADHR